MAGEMTSKQWAKTASDAVKKWAVEHGFTDSTRSQIATHLGIDLKIWYKFLTGEAVHEQDLTIYARLYALTGLKEVDPREIPARTQPIFGRSSQPKSRKWTEGEYDTWLRDHPIEPIEPHAVETKTSARSRARRPRSPQAAQPAVALLAAASKPPKAEPAVEIAPQPAPMQQLMVSVQIPWEAFVTGDAAQQIAAMVALHMGGQLQEMLQSVAPELARQIAERLPNIYRVVRRDSSEQRGPTPEPLPQEPTNGTDILRLAKQLREAIDAQVGPVLESPAELDMLGQKYGQALASLYGRLDLLCRTGQEQRYAVRAYQQNQS